MKNDQERKQIEGGSQGRSVHSLPERWKRRVL